MVVKVPGKCSYTICVHLTPTQKKSGHLAVLFTCVDDVRYRDVMYNLDYWHVYLIVLAMLRLMALDVLHLQFKFIPQ